MAFGLTGSIVAVFMFNHSVEVNYQRLASTEMPSVAIQVSKRPTDLGVAGVRLAIREWGVLWSVGFLEGDGCDLVNVTEE